MAPTPGEPDATVVTAAPTLPGYELLEVVGSGGAGTVYCGRQLRLDRPVAIKAVRPDRCDAPNLTARFEAEAVILGKLRHPHIVQVHDLVRHDGQLFLVLELLDGEDLGRRVERLGPCDERFAWAVARQAAAALAHAAAHGVVHRDVKPSNLFLVGDPAGPVVKVMDFGLAKRADPTTDLHTLPGTLMGTPAYMAPEQARGAAGVDHRADIYSLGATVYHALAGGPPFAGRTVWDMMAEKLRTSPRLGPPVSRRSAELVAAMMAPDPTRRIGSYPELLARIDAVLAEPGAAPAGRPPAPTGRTRWPYRIAGGLTATIIVGVGVWATVGGRAVQTAGLTGRQPAAPRLEPSGDHLALFDGRSLNGWRSPGGLWQVGRDEEGAKVLVGSGAIRRGIDLAGDCRLTIGLDVHKASAAEVQLWSAAGPGPAVRISRDAGAALEGGRTGQAAGPPVPFPPAAWFEGRQPYLEVRLERAGGRWSAWFNGREVGRGATAGAESEVRLVGRGGQVRIDSVVLTPLHPVNTGP